MDIDRNKVVRLIDFLSKLATLKGKIVREIKEYDNVLWLSEIPRDNKYSYTKAWGIANEIDEDNWIEIQKYPEPRVPVPPDICTDWIDSEQLLNINSLPKLTELIEVETVTKDHDGNDVIEYEHKNLIEFPEIAVIWQKYVDEEWVPWSKRLELWLKVHKVYSILFNIYQKQLKEGEEHELFLGVGLLKWKTPSNQIVQRHLVVGKASIEFEASKGRFTIKSSPNGADIHVEIDMIDQQHQPPKIKQLEQDGLMGVNNDLWDKSSVDPLITAITNSLASDGRGEYFPDLLMTSLLPISEIPIVEYAPALFLRKRSIRNLVSTLEEIKKQVEDGSYIPEVFLELCEFNVDQSDAQKDIVIEPEGDIYFPLPANEAQLRIIGALRKNYGVLVQGPPGTGKSLTIANLICHLLATGKKILVTAKTPRALQVLQEKLPDQMKPLGISLLGEGLEEKDSLEKSVKGILGKQSQWIETVTEKKIEDLQKEIYILKKDKTENELKLRILREAETYSHDIGGFYFGTAAKIAKDLQIDDEKYAWLTDDIQVNQSIPLSSHELDELCADLKIISADLEKELNFFIPQADIEIPGKIEIAKLFSNEKRIIPYRSENNELLPPNLVLILRQTEIENISNLSSSISTFCDLESELGNSHNTWIKKAIEEVLSNNSSKLNELLRISKNKVQGLRDKAANIGNLKVKIPENLDRQKILKDAISVKNHLEEGKKLKGYLFKSSFAKNHHDLLEKVFIDGVLCNTLEACTQLIDYLDVEFCLESIWSLWSGKAETKEHLMVLQIAEIEDLNASLETVLKLDAALIKAKDSIRAIKELHLPDWKDKELLNNIIRACKAVEYDFEFQINQESINLHQDKLNTLSRLHGCHALVHKLYEDFLERNIDAYNSDYDELEELSKLKKIQERIEDKLDKLAPYVPILINAVKNSVEKEIWAEKLTLLDNGWAWAQAKTWLDKFIKNDLTSLEAESNRLEASIKQHISEIAAEKAWFFCCSRLDNPTRQHLVAWRQAMNNYGNGAGKYASNYLQDAQNHFHQCVDAIPAWIMPLHRVYETIKARPGLFDVVIVDEASQCGFEALPLLYLGKHIIVVGDDKQIAPEAVATDRAPVFQLMNTYLNDFQHRNSFNITDSLFDHADRLFSSPISLREHFRCVPEIIRFSNDLCYESHLIPLRQYPPNRLDPIKSIHVMNGFREGSGVKVINKAEAEILVDTVVECCRNKAYENKSMGIITLQGGAQSNLIESMLLEKLGAKEIEKRRIICGNPYTFQGDERDVIYLSMVAATNEKNGTLSNKYDERRFNVAASRAKDQMWLFHSVTINDLGPRCLRRRLLEYFTNPIRAINDVLGDIDQLKQMAASANRQIQRAPIPYDSWFEVDVILKIAAKGYRVIPQFEYAGKYIDMIIEDGLLRLAVECDGDHWHGLEQYENDVARQRMLERCGWHFFRIRECEFYASPEKLLNRLWSELDYRKIQPVSGLTKSVEVILDKSPVAIELETPERQDETKSGIKKTQITKSNKSEKKSSIQTIPEFCSTPKTAKEALLLKPSELREFIIDVLENRPNNSCLKNKLATEVLKKCEIITRGSPRLNFERKVLDVIKYMNTQGYVEIYHTGVNERIKLGAVKLPRQNNLLQ